MTEKLLSGFILVTMTLLSMPARSAEYEYEKLEDCMKFLRQFMIILLLSFLGEVLKMFIPLPIPASVYGLVLMLLCLVTGILKTSQVKEAAFFMIEIMPVMFIPAAAGLIDSWKVLQPLLLPILVITVVITIFVMVVTGKIAQMIAQKRGIKNE